MVQLRCNLTLTSIELENMSSLPQSRLLVLAGMSSLLVGAGIKLYSRVAIGLRTLE